MKNSSFNAIVIAFLAAVFSTSLFAQDQAWESFEGYDRTLVWPYEAADLEILRMPKASGDAVRSQVLISGTIDIPESQKDFSVDSAQFDGVIDGAALSGEIYITRAYDGKQQEAAKVEKFSWDLDPSGPFISFQSGSDELFYYMTPVIFPASSLPEHINADSQVERLFGKQARLLEALLKSPAIRIHLPKTLYRGLGLGAENKDSEVTIHMSMSGISDSSKSLEEWGCGIACGTAIGTGLSLFFVSGGILTPGAAGAAALCGTCMGYLFNYPVISQTNIYIPPIGGSPVGAWAFLAPLPPGWHWECRAMPGGYTCKTVRSNIAFPDH